eukprot:637232-Pyramimonas_sp.AAC.1
MPINLGIKAIHGGVRKDGTPNLRGGLLFYDAFLATYWQNYLAANITTGPGEQVADLAGVCLSTSVDQLKKTGVSHAVSRNIARSISRNTARNTARTVLSLM